MNEDLYLVEVRQFNRKSIFKRYKTYKGAKQCFINLKHEYKNNDNIKLYLWKRDSIEYQQQELLDDTNWLSDGTYWPYKF